MTNTQRRKVDGTSPRADWRKSAAFKSIRQQIRAAVSENPSLADEFAAEVDKNPTTPPLAKRAQAGEFAAHVIEEKYGGDTLAHVKAMTGGAD
jgi:hypothetical protein